MSIEIFGKQYVTVAERLALVHQSGKSFEVVASEPLTVGERVLWRVTIKIEDRTFVGTAEAKIENARKGSPDASNPFECAETSALGRCLGFAGYGAPDSVCSADELQRGQPTPAQARLNAIYDQGKQSGRWSTSTEMLDKIADMATN